MSATVVKRLMSELRKCQNDPDGLFVAGLVDESDLFFWHFTIKGPKDTPFEGGIYHGTITFPQNYPLSPPDVEFLTPNGRFQTNTRLCLSFTSYHPESWNPGWDVRTELISLIAFFPTSPDGAIGGISTDSKTRRKLAQSSRTWKCDKCHLHLEPDPWPEEKEDGPKLEQDHEAHQEEEENHETNTSTQNEEEEIKEEEKISENLHEEEVKEEVHQEEEIQQQNDDENTVKFEELNQEQNIEEKPAESEQINPNTPESDINDNPHLLTAEELYREKLFFVDTQIGATDLFDPKMLSQTYLPEQPKEEAVISKPAEKSLSFNPIRDIFCIILLIIIFVL